MLSVEYRIWHRAPCATQCIVYLMNPCKPLPSWHVCISDYGLEKIKYLLFYDYNKHIHIKNIFQIDLKVCTVQ